MVRSEGRVHSGKSVSKRVHRDLYRINTWSLTKIAEIKDPSGLKDKLSAGDVAVVFSADGDKSD